MSLDALFVQLTHTGLDKFGKPFTGSLYLPDIHEHYEGQSRTSVHYVPAGQTVRIPMTGRVVYSMTKGTIKKFVDAGYLTANTLAGHEGSFFDFPPTVTSLPCEFSGTISGSPVNDEILFYYQPVNILLLSDTVSDYRFYTPNLPAAPSTLYIGYTQGNFNFSALVTISFIPTSNYGSVSLSPYIHRLINENLPEQLNVRGGPFASYLNTVYFSFRGFI